MNATILLIEDDKSLRENTTNVLEIAGFQILEAKSGKEGIEMAGKNNCDMIICDINLHEMDGYSLLYLISKKAEFAAVPFIFINWKTEPMDIRKALTLGADDFLNAPFSNLDLLNSIECQLKKREKQKAFYIRTTFKNNCQQFSDAKVELKQAISNHKIKKVKARYPVFSEGDPVNGIYLLLEGRVKSVKLNDDGRELVTAIYSTNEYFGLHDLLMNDSYTETVEAIDDSKVCLLPRESVIDLINRNPGLGKEFIRILSAEIIQKEEHLLQLAYHSVRKRVAEALLRLGKKLQNYDQEKQILIDVPREDLAGIAGVAIETVCRTLTDFQNEGILEKEGLKIHLLNINKLEKMRN